jgi:outer membrane protein assembly factor BamB
MIVLVLSWFLSALATAPNQNEAQSEALANAARSGDAAQVGSLLDKGVDVNAKGRYGATALFFAADKGHLDVVKLLIARGADINIQDTFYRTRPINWALSNDHADVAIFLLEKQSKGADDALMSGVRSNNPRLVKAALASSDLDRRTLQAALATAERDKRAELVPTIKAALDALPLETEPEVKLDPAVLQRYVGRYRNETAGVTATISVRDSQLLAEVPGQPPITFAATGESTFRAREMDGLTIAFNGRGGMVESVTVNEQGRVSSYARLSDAATTSSTAPPATPPGGAASPDRVYSRTPPRNWPSFRGELASGNGDGQGVVSEWDVATGKNVSWKTAIPGIATASPIIWGDRVFLTTAVSAAGDSSFRTGLYGDVKPVDDLSEHQFKIYCLDKKTGRILWDRTAFSGAPKVKRHTKSTQANSTPASDGKRVVAAFGSVGLLVAYDLDGKELWRADLGVLDSGWFFDPTYQWGHSSSPVIYKNSVIVQADIQKGSYLAAWDLTTGKQIWKTERDEIPTWGTPALVTGARDEIVTNGTKIRGYDPATGKLLWTLGPNSEVTVATPIAGDGLVYITAGYPPVRPIYAVKTGATGDISLPTGSESSDAIAWSNSREGTYIPTPILYGGHLFTCNNNGIVNVYDAKTGQRAGRGRIGEGGAFSASPVAADGKLYFASEDGDVHVVRATPTLDPIAKNAMKEVMMATPAISDGLIVVRTLGHVYGIGQ